MIEDPKPRTVHVLRAAAQLVHRWHLVFVSGYEVAGIYKVFLNEGNLGIHQREER